MSKRWVPVLVVAALSLSAAARAEKPSVAIAPVTGDRATDDLRSRVAKSLADGLVAAGAAVAPTGSAAYVLRGTLEVEGRSYALRLEMLDGRTGAVLATREDRCEICTETEALETWNTAASTLKARVIKRPEGAASSPVASAPGATVSLGAPPPRNRPRRCSWTRRGRARGRASAPWGGRQSAPAPSGSGWGRSGRATTGSGPATPLNRRPARTVTTTTSGTAGPSPRPAWRWSAWGSWRCSASSDGHALAGGRGGR